MHGDDRQRVRLEPTQQTLAVRGPEAAQMLGVSQRKLWELANRGEIPTIRFDRCVRYRPSDLQEYLDRHLSSGPGGDR